MWNPALFQEDRTIWLWACLALLLHLLLGTAISLSPSEQLRRPPAIEGIAVEIITPAPATATPEVQPAPDDALAAAGTALPQAPDGMLRATRLYSAAILDNPKSRKAKARLRQLVSEDRIIQLCNLEALEQVQRWNPRFNPDFLVAYARSDVRLAGARAIEAGGGAFHDGNRWHEIRYRCETTPDLASVVAFEFAVGLEIPRGKWEAYSLPAHVESVD